VSTANQRFFFYLAALNAEFDVWVADTTLFSPGWTTNGTYDTYWSFLNTTSATVTGTLTLVPNGGGGNIDVPVTIAAGNIFGTNTSALAVPRGKVGSARFVHDGPTGAVLIKANQANFAVSPPFIELVPFETVRERQ
jgi:hypothetical protein